MSVTGVHARYTRVRARAYDRAQRRFRAMLACGNYHGLEAHRYVEAERLLDRVNDAEPQAIIAEVRRAQAVQ